MLLKVTSFNLEDCAGLDMWLVSGKEVVAKGPFSPYCFGHSQILMAHNTPMTRTLLSTLAPKQIWQLSFPNMKLLERSRVPGVTFEDRVKYVHRVAVDLGYKFPSGLPTHNSLDIECRSLRGQFPWSKQDPISAVGYCRNGEKECVTIDDEPEYELIGWLSDKIHRNDPDLVDTYWGSYFDFPYILDRSSILGVPFNVGRKGGRPRLFVHTFESGKKKGIDQTVDIQGRVHFDVWKEVDQDQALFGIKNKKLKTVARWFGLSPIIEVDPTRIHKLPTEELQEYCANDAYLTWCLAEIYLRNLYMLAEELALPLNLVVERAPSHPSNFIYMRRFRELGIVADKANMERYPKWFVAGRKAYQGALVKLFKAGVFRPIRKVDFKSMYPTIMDCFDLSPENLLKTEITAGDPGWLVKFEGNKISFYDMYLGVVTITVDLTKDSVSRQVIEEFIRRREQIKAEIKQFSKTPALTSQQWMIKLLMNAMTGYHGMKWALCGCVPVIAAITGIGRFLITETSKWLVTQPDVQLIEYDTDGIYYCGPDYTSEINTLIQSLIPDQFNKSVLKVESETFEAGVFYEEKGYVLQERGKLIFHGSGLKGRHLPNICDKALTSVTQAVLSERNPIEVLQQYLDLRGYPFSDFLMTVKLSKKPGTYHRHSMYSHLIAKMQASELPVRWGDEIQFVKTADRGYMPLGALPEYNLDYRYYRARIADVTERILMVTHSLSAKQLKTVLGVKK